MIQSFHIDGFRGIHNLTVDNLNSVNLIVGDNNCGKTSVLEALQLLSAPSQISNLFRVARSRDFILTSGGVSLYENVMCLFPHTESRYEIGIHAIINDRQVDCCIHGEESRIMIVPEETSGEIFQHSVMLGETEADQFIGSIDYVYANRRGSTPLHLNTFSKASGVTIGKSSVIRMAYISPSEHLRSNIVSQIVRNDEYKEICIAALQLFDPDIIDILQMKSTVGIRVVDYLKHRTLGSMPLSTFGDGVKKVLVLANAIARSANGVLLIDEVETAIHKKYYDDIFRFIVKACRTFHVQVFITTHSIEAVDGLLATQDYHQQTMSDDISVITIKKENRKSYSRILSGREVAENRESFGFEVRL
ncbi:MAG: AAA family ATPase [Clostridiales bacterium]|nr:AAA family ATPase [Clostridiales bacterium]